jgi:methylated-DNA-[protein]-cysteine S-methyltransferase
MSEPLRLFVDHLETPIGRFALVADEEGRLRAAGFMDAHARMQRQLATFAERPECVLAEAVDPGGLTAAIARYFAGEVSAIDDLPVACPEGTPFQREVWRTLREIPCGTTWSYAELARRIGRPAAVRAVGLANGANPVGLVVPCHRVIGSDGSLTGYGGGVERKRWLLAHEGRGAHGTLFSWAEGLNSDTPR